MTDHYAQTIHLLPMNGANNGTVFTDWSPLPKTVTRVGSSPPVTSTAQFAFSKYGSSGRFIGGYLEFGSNQNPGSETWSAEFWVYIDALPTPGGILGLFEKWSSTGDQRGTLLLLRNDNGVHKMQYRISDNGSNVVEAEWTNHTLNAGNWHHIRVGKDDDGMYISANSSIVATEAATNTYDSTAPWFIGYAVGQEFIGYMQDWLLQIGGDSRRNIVVSAPLIGTISNTNGDPITDENGAPAQRKIFAVPRSYFGAGGVGRIWSTESGADGSYELWAPAGVEHSRIIVAQDSGSPSPADPVLPDLIDRVIPA